MVIATFAATVTWVTIGAGALNLLWLRAYDADMNVLATTWLTPTPGYLANPPPIARPQQQADMSVVAFTLLGPEPEPVGAGFDNLHFKRPTP